MKNNLKLFAIGLLLSTPFAFSGLTPTEFLNLLKGYQGKTLTLSDKQNIAKAFFGLGPKALFNAANQLKALGLTPDDLKKSLEIKKEDPLNKDTSGQQQKLKDMNPSKGDKRSPGIEKKTISEAPILQVPVVTPVPVKIPGKSSEQESLKTQNMPGSDGEASAPIKKKEIPGQSISQEPAKPVETPAPEKESKTKNADFKISGDNKTFVFVINGTAYTLNENGLDNLGFIKALDKEDNNDFFKKIIDSLNSDTSREAFINHLAIEFGTSEFSDDNKKIFRNLLAPIISKIKDGTAAKNISVNWLK